MSESGDERLASALRQARPSTSSKTVERALALVRRRLFPRRAGIVRIDRYVLLHQIASGGMGVVYAAYDPDLDRKVALKLVDPDPDHPEDRVKRDALIREAKAAARINHPNVVRVYDTGLHGSTQAVTTQASDAGDASVDPSVTQDGDEPRGNLVFIVFELIEGVDLRTWLWTRARTWNEVVKVFAAIGRGLAAAHERGVIHGDFKPENVLVEPGGVAKVLDFGLARTLTHPRSDPVGGTPGYAAPELAVGPGDERIDQYSLCVALHEALYGGPPFAPDSGAAPPREGPRPPDRIRRLVFRGGSPNPGERFPSMRALVEQLERDHGRTLRRVVALAGAAMAGALVLALALPDRTPSPPCAPEDDAIPWTPEKKEQLRGWFSQTARPEVASQFETIAALLDDHTSELVRTWKKACALQPEGVLPMDQRSCLEQRFHELEGTVNALSVGGPDTLARGIELVNRNRAPSLCIDGSIDDDLLWPPAPAPQREAVEEVRRLATLSRIQQWTGDYERGLALAREALELARETEFLPAIVVCQADVGLLQLYLTRVEEGRENLFEAALRAEAAGMDQTLAQTRARIALTFANVDQRFDEALRWMEMAEAAARRALPRTRRPLGRVLQGRAYIANAMGEHEAARDYAQRAVAELRRSESRDLPGEAVALMHWARAEQHLGDVDRAIDLHIEALETFEGAIGRTHPLAVNALSELAYTTEEHGDLASALVMHRRALAMNEAIYAHEHPDIGGSHHSVGALLRGLGELPQAEYHLSQALTHMENSMGSDHWRTHAVRYALGLLRRDQGRVDEGLLLVEDATEALSRTMGAEHPQVRKMRVVRAAILVELGRVDEAREVHQTWCAGPEDPPTRDLSKLCADLKSKL